MGSRVLSTVGCFPELCFFQFSVAQVLVGLRKPFIKKKFSPLLPGLLVFIIIILCIIVLQVMVRTEAGTYVKELVHGDLGRTVPNLSSILGCEVDILALDVMVRAVRDIDTCHSMPW